LGWARIQIGGTSGKLEIKPDETRDLCEVCWSQLQTRSFADRCIHCGRSHCGCSVLFWFFQNRGDRRKAALATAMAADCMQLVGDIQNPDLQRHFLELARLLTAAAESTAVPALTISI
jgi:hypothetical protein